MPRRITKYTIVIGIAVAFAISSVFILSSIILGLNPCTLPFTIPFGSAVQAPATEEELFEGADIVLVGEVKNRQSKCEGTGIVTDYTIEVNLYLKNPLNKNTLTARTYGGEIRGYGIWVEDQPSFDIRDKVFLYLHKKDDV